MRAFSEGRVLETENEDEAGVHRFRYVPLQYWPKGSTGRLQRYLRMPQRWVLHLLGWAIWQLADLTPTRSTTALVPTAP
jgi:hypothetical protein